LGYLRIGFVLFNQPIVEFVAQCKQMKGEGMQIVIRLRQQQQQQKHQLSFHILECLCDGQS